MKNYYLNKLPKQLLLFAFFLTGFVSFSQSAKKLVVSQYPNSTTTLPLNDLSEIKRDTPRITANYTSTNSSLSVNNSPEIKAEFLKNHNANHYYVYSDDKVKIVTKDELEMALQLEQSNSINKTPIINLRINS